MKVSFHLNGGVGWFNSSVAGLWAVARLRGLIKGPENTSSFPLLSYVQLIYIPIEWVV